MTMNNHHFLLVSFPFQSHINPTIRLATKLTRGGARVTFVTTVNGLKNLKTRPSFPGLSYDSFSDGHDESGSFGKPNYLQEIKLVGAMNLKKLLLTKAKEGEKVDILIYGLGLPWVAEVARELHVPSTFFFFQSATSFSLVYHLFKSDGGMLNSIIDPTSTLKIRGLSLLKHNDIPSYLQPSDVSYSTIPFFKEHIEILETHPNPCILINTFDELEEESIKSIPDSINIFPVGPLVPSEIEEPFVCDIFHDSDRETYLRWLDSKPEKSVIYMSFGSMSELGENQKEEIFQGLILSGHPFLCVICNKDEEQGQNEMKNYTYEEDGCLILRWCSQVEVLNHIAIRCFVTHCGWNSMVESVVSGVPVVGCPQFADQMMNAKMVEEVWGNGVKAVADKEGVVGREEIRRCLEVVTGCGKMAEKIRRKCEKLKTLALEAMEEDGSSFRNLKQLFESLYCVSYRDGNGVVETKEHIFQS